MFVCVLEVCNIAELKVTFSYGVIVGKWQAIDYIRNFGGPPRQIPPDLLRHEILYLNP